MKVNIVKYLGGMGEHTGSDKYSFELKFNKSKA